MCRAMEALQTIKTLEDVTITPEQAAPVLKCTAQSIRLQAQEDPKMLGFNVSRIGGRTVIPRIPFIRFVEGS